MLEYLKYLFQQLKAQNRKLTDIAVIQNRLWVLFKEGNQTEKWLFESNGNLVVSIEGNVTDGSWRYIAATNQIIIDCKGLKMLFNQNFIHDNILLLRKDSSELDFLVLYDDKEFSRVQFMEFLKDVKRKDIAETRVRLNITEIELSDGSMIELIREPGQSSKIQLGNIVIRNGEPISEDSVRTKDRQILELTKGKIKKIYYLRTYILDNKNNIDVKQKEFRKVRKGDIIIKFETKIENGLHQLYSLSGVLIEGLTISYIYDIIKKKSILGKNLTIWTNLGNTLAWGYSGGYVYIDNQLAPNGFYITTDLRFIKVKRGKII
jgi:hypothetical protein